MCISAGSCVKSKLSQYIYFFQAHPLNGAAVYPYESKSPSNLSFQAGDIITLLDAR